MTSAFLMGNVEHSVLYIKLCVLAVTLLTQGYAVYVQKADVENISGARGVVNENMSALSAHMALGKYQHGLPPNEKPSPDQIRSKLSLEILFQANPVSPVHTFGTARYCICMKGKIAISKSSFDSSAKLMNHRLEIYRKCKHSSEFHRFAVSTYESCEDKQVDESSCLSNHDFVF
eukprot:5186960-Ditylum_brightwellii.AAC.1